MIKLIKYDHLDLLRETKDLAANMINLPGKLGGSTCDAGGPK